MAKFCDEQAQPTAEASWARVKALITVGKTVEVYRKSVDGTPTLFLRVWTGKRKDGSNLVAADPQADY
jgi:hypothetical protein